jgi:hypothetical protein
MYSNDPISVGFQKISSSRKKEFSDKSLLQRKVNPRVGSSPPSKFVDVRPGATFPTLGIGYSLLNGLQVGFQPYNRLGRKITLASLDFSLLIAPTAFSGTLGAFERLRCMFVYDRQPSQVTTSTATNAFPLTADLVASYSATGGVSTDATSLPNPLNSSRFLILWDSLTYAPPYHYNGTTKLYTVGPQLDTERGTWSVQASIPLDGLVTRFNGNSRGDITDITTGALYFAYIGIAGSLYEWFMSARLFFDDY